MNYSRFEVLPIWQKSREMAKLVFEITSKEPFCKDFKFKDQIRSSSASVMDNIAEGFERSGNKEFIQFLYIAKGSCGETRSQSYRAFDYGYLDETTLNELKIRTEEISSEISNFIKYLKSSDLKGYKYKS